jgi:hypothetical protein
MFKSSFRKAPKTHLIGENFWILKICKSTSLVYRTRKQLELLTCRSVSDIFQWLQEKELLEMCYAIHPEDRLPVAVAAYHVQTQKIKIFVTPKWRRQGIENVLHRILLCRLENNN